MPRRRRKSNLSMLPNRRIKFNRRFFRNVLKGLIFLAIPCVIYGGCQLAAWVFHLTFDH